MRSSRTPSLFPRSNSRPCPVPSRRIRSGTSLASLAALSLLGAATGGCDSLTSPPEPVAIAADTTTAAAASAKPAAPTASASAAPSAAAPPSDPDAKLVQTDLVVGKGAEAKVGDKVSVHYVGTLASGSEFDSSRKRGQPFVFTLGKGQVIRGWDQGVAGMKVGGKRKLVIPPALAYGDRGMGNAIPPKSTLTFEVELVDIKK
jgi:FKBP-type peptidyl-prolyl cis-trans isomerase